MTGYMGGKLENPNKSMVKRTPTIGFGSREVDQLGIMGGEAVDLEDCTC